VQLPPEQYSSEVQVVPHEPQLDESRMRSRQNPEHMTSPVWQEGAQAPAEQTSPALHVVPQAPQLR
jgi:hypothetical protein